MEIKGRPGRASPLDQGHPVHQPWPVGLERTRYLRHHRYSGIQRRRCGQRVRCTRSIL